MAGEATKGTIAQAYVQIMPSMEGVQGALEQGFNATGVGTSVGRSLGSSIKSALISTGVITAVGKIFKDTLSEGAALQQSYMGGVDTLYGEAADMVRGFADEAAAYGVSMNEYSEQAVSFGAALKQAYGGDAVQAAEAANMAIQDMADNSAKMGTDLESIQYAYQGFAKSNYTMLDNLKLGYGGTKTEMERLLADAEELSGVHYDISNLGDVYSAIHVIQENLGLTGVAAEEASETFSGSFNAMKAAAQNFLGVLSTGGDVKAALQTLIDTSTTFIIDNLLPMLGQIGQGLVQVAIALKPYVIEFVHQIPGWLAENLPGMIATIAELVAALLTGILEVAGDLLQNGLLPLVGGVLDQVAGAVSDGFGRIKDAFWSILQPVYNAIVSGITAVRRTVTGILGGIRSAFVNTFNRIKGFLSPMIQWLKGIFNFQWHLPQIKLPHFSISGGFSLNPPSAPHFSIEWYDKAMNRAMVLDSPTVFGASGSSLLAGGESGAEVVSGEAHLVDLIKDAVSGGARAAPITIIVNPSQGMDEKELADLVADRLNEQIARQKGAFAG